MLNADLIAKGMLPNADWLALITPLQIINFGHQLVIGIDQPSL